jgi:hypothetical protein
VQGFGVRRQKDGTYYYLRFRKNGVQRMRSIGRHGSPWTPDTARNEVKRLLGLAVGGVDLFVKPLLTESFGHEVVRYLERKRVAIRVSAVTSNSIGDQNFPPLFLVETEYRLALMRAEQHFVAELIRRVESGWGPLELWRGFHEDREATIAKLYRQYGGAPME